MVSSCILLSQWEQREKLLSAGLSHKHKSTKCTFFLRRSGLALFILGPVMPGITSRGTSCPHLQTKVQLETKHVKAATRHRRHGPYQGAPGCGRAAHSLSSLCLPTLIQAIASFLKDQSQKIPDLNSVLESTKTGGKEGLRRWLTTTYLAKHLGEENIFYKKGVARSTTSSQVWVSFWFSSPWNQHQQNRLNPKPINDSVEVKLSPACPRSLTFAA